MTGFLFLSAGVICAAISIYAFRYVLTGLLPWERKQ